MLKTSAGYNPAQCMFHDIHERFEVSAVRSSTYCRLLSTARLVTSRIHDSSFIYHRIHKV